MNINFCTELCTKTTSCFSRASSSKRFTFILFFLAGIFLFGILKQFRQLDLRSKQATVLIFLVIPVYHARISGIVFAYSVSYFTFFLGWVMIVRRNKIWRRALALLAIFLSFHTESLLFFVLLPFVNFLVLVP